MILLNEYQNFLFETFSSGYNEIMNLLLFLLEEYYLNGLRIITLK